MCVLALKVRYRNDLTAVKATHNETAKDSDIFLHLSIGVSMPLSSSHVSAGMGKPTMQQTRCVSKASDIYAVSSIL